MVLKLKTKLGIILTPAGETLLSAVERQGETETLRDYVERFKKRGRGCERLVWEDEVVFHEERPPTWESILD